MKKFIFGVMLLVSLLGIVGCSNPSNSDGLENDTYIVKNGTGSKMTISYKNKSGNYVTGKNIPGGGTYEIPASDIKIETITYPDGSKTFTGGYLKVNCNGEIKDLFVEKVMLEKGVKILENFSIDSI